MDMLDLHTNVTGAIYNSTGKPMKAEFFHGPHEPDEHQRDVNVTMFHL